MDYIKGSLPTGLHKGIPALVSLFNGVHRGIIFYWITDGKNTFLYESGVLLRPGCVPESGVPVRNLLLLLLLQ